MCCGEEMHGHHAGHSAFHRGEANSICGCGCGGRRFLSKKERIGMLEEYSESLKSELEGVEEELKSLKNELKDGD
jgi:hypothetical protein